VECIVGPFLLNSESANIGRAVVVGSLLLVSVAVGYAGYMLVRAQTAVATRAAGATRLLSIIVKKSLWPVSRLKCLSSVEAGISQYP